MEKSLLEQALTQKEQQLEKALKQVAVLRTKISHIKKAINTPAPKAATIKKANVTKPSNNKPGRSKRSATTR